MVRVVAISLWTSFLCAPMVRIVSLRSNVVTCPAAFAYSLARDPTASGTAVGTVATPINYQSSKQSPSEQANIRARSTGPNHHECDALMRCVEPRASGRDAMATESPLRSPADCRGGNSRVRELAEPEPANG